MNDKEPNKIINNLYKKHIISKTIAQDLNWIKEQEMLIEELCNIVSRIGAIEVMSKQNILKVCRMQVDLNFLSSDQLLKYISKAEL